MLVPRKYTVIILQFEPIRNSLTNDRSFTDHQSVRRRNHG